MDQHSARTESPHTAAEAVPDISSQVSEQHILRSKINAYLETTISAKEIR